MDYDKYITFDQLFFFQDFIEKCLEKDPEKRLTARDLLFHSVLFEVHSLALLAAHAVVNNCK